MSASTRHIAILTGDLVNSTTLGPAKIEQAFAALQDYAEAHEHWHGHNLRFTRHRGDGWQVTCTLPWYAWRSALAFRAALKAQGPEFDTYIGMADGNVPTPLPDDLNRATSAPFEASGAALDFIKATPNQRLGYHGGGVFSATAALFDHISADWTQAQAQAILPKLTSLDKSTVTDIAAQLGKSRQTVAKSLDAAGYNTIQYALACLEDMENA